VSTLSRTISILGVTGSIGESTIQVVEDIRSRGGNIEVAAITAGANLPALVKACERLRPKFAAIADAALLAEARDALSGLGVDVGAGPTALVEAAARPSDWVMAAIVGAAGLPATMEAVRRGAQVALANKECLVCAGPLFLDAASAHGAKLLPVDSEHNAIFQVLTHPAQVEKLTLTASGGPFLNARHEEMAKATPDQACAHPKWSMGRKISVDSASLMNKGLELIEASYLFDIEGKNIDIVVHPQSLVHSFVHYADGSILAQLGAPDMRIPIAYALAWPSRTPVATHRLDLATMGSLTFQAPDETLFPALRLCREALGVGGSAPAVLNAANEIAVSDFLAGRIGFLDIAATVERTLEGMSRVSEIEQPPSSFEELALVDEAARAMAKRIAGTLAAA
jgi:1-deoxy-D-xylulose-5-phosphate reductoisomerase